MPIAAPTIQYGVAHELIAKLRKIRDEVCPIIRPHVQDVLEYVEAQPKGDLPEAEGKLMRKGKAKK